MIIQLAIIILLIMQIMGGSFISDKEYGAMLFTSPRGVSCKNCHNENLQNKELSSYQIKEKKYIIKIPKVKSITLKKLKNALNGKSIMPSYYFTDKELEALWAYLKQK